MSRIFIALTAVNSALLMLLLAEAWPAIAKTEAGVLRGSALEIVDAAGRVRASIGVLPGGTSEGGEAYSETVLLRLIDANGQPSVKVGTTDSGAGLSFVGGDDLSYIVLEAIGADSSLKIVEPDGHELVVTP